MMDNWLKGLCSPVSGIVGWMVGGGDNTAGCREFAPARCIFKNLSFLEPNIIMLLSHSKCMNKSLNGIKIQHDLYTRSDFFGPIRQMKK
jgi:hypothetical protein